MAIRDGISNELQYEQEYAEKVDRWGSLQKYWYIAVILSCTPETESVPQS